MSSIAVVWNRAGGEPKTSYLIGPLLEVLRPYGPQREFSWIEGQREGEIAMGGNLSGTLPEDEYDTQPLLSADGEWRLVCDLRLDNRDDLARELGLAQPEAVADSGLLMAAWMRWGEACVDHILGGFVFAAWNPRRRELFVARDHAGERPAYYLANDRTFVLATMPQAILALPGASRGIDLERAAEWTGLLSAEEPGSMFRGIKAVPFGSLLRVTREGVECRRYWHPRDAPAVRFGRDEEYAEGLLEVLDRATESRLRARGPVGSMLSAGLDCSSVTASAAGILGRQGRELTAFTAVPRAEFDGLANSWELRDEGPAAAETARMYANIRHVVVDSAGYELLPVMRSWIDALGAPVLNVTNLLWFTAICDAARSRGIRVVLEGVSGNATISWETRAVFSDFFRQGRWGTLARTAYRLRRHGGISVRRALKASLAGVLPRRVARMLSPAPDLAHPYAPPMTAEFSRRYRMQERIAASMLDEPLNTAAEHARFIEEADLGPLHAAYQAAGGVEFRDPTADKRVYEYCFGIPAEQYVAGGHSRSLVRRAMRSRLPEATVRRYARGRQAADWYITLREAVPELREEIGLQRQSPLAREVLELGRMLELVETMPRAGFHTVDAQLNWHMLLTRAVSLGYFLRSHDPAASGASK